jgi:iron complex outermembrane recepter protein
MKRTTGKTIRLMLNTSLIALATGVAGMTLSGLAQAQTQTTPTADTPKEDEVIVIGARKSERSAIQRKKRAATAQDSIVADDVGNFPDKNVGDAIARIAGVALGVSDSGEQSGFTIRGQSPDLIRVEVDGMAMMSTGQDGRSVTALGDMSSDLIKSVEQRSGLDFNKPLYKFNLQYQKSSLDDTWTPRANIIATRKFFGGRLGLLFNLTYDQVNNVTDVARVANSGAGYIPLGDYDNSPEKTFTQAFDPVAAAVTTKAGCAALSTVQGINSRLNCYAQWEDYLPSLPRFSREFRDDRTTSLQLRADYKVNDNLTVFASYNPNIRDFKNTAFNLQIAAPIGTTNTSGALATSNIRNVIVNENHFVTQYDMVKSPTTGTAPLGYVANVVWDSQTRMLHRVTEQHYAQVGADLKWRNWLIKGRAQYSLASADRQDDTIKIFAQLPSATFKLVPESGLWTYEAPAGTDLISPSAYYPIAASNGLSATAAMEYTPQYDETSETNLQLDAVRTFSNSSILKTVKFGVQKRDRDNETWRYNGFDVKPGVTLFHARRLDVVRWCNPATAPTTAPCVFGTTQIPPGTSLANSLYMNHTITQAQYNGIIDAAVMQLPGSQYMNGLPDRGNLISSWMVPNFNTFSNLLSQYADLSGHNPDCLYRCMASDGNMYDRPSYSTEEGTLSAYLMTDFETQLWGMDVVGNIGVRYQKIDVKAKPSVIFYDRVAQPFTTVTGGVTSKGFRLVDTMTLRRESEIDRTSEDVLPSFNLAAWPIQDQLVARYSIAKQRARPSMTQLTGASAASCYKVNPADREALEAYLAQNPGAFDDGNATTDDSGADDVFLNSYINRCTGTIGNPGLKGYEAITQNLSLEWYPNKDTQLSVATYQIEAKTDYPVTYTASGYELEGNEYTVTTVRDGDPNRKTTGVEISGRTAFTFLPSYLRYTGGGFNYTHAESTGAVLDYDYFSAQFMPPRTQSENVYNINLWYDDGRLNARVAYQYRDQWFDKVDPESVNRIPAGSYRDGTQATTAYFKSVQPIFKSGARALDARASYKLNKHVELFVEGKNLLHDSVTRFTPEEYIQLNDQGTPYVFDKIFNGSRYYFGIISTF